MMRGAGRPAPSRDATTHARWAGVARETIREVAEDNCLGLAAQLAFYFLLALFPALLFFLALVAYLPVERAATDLLLLLATVAPDDLIALLSGELDRLVRDSHAGLLTAGGAGAVWSSSAAMVATIDAMNRAYDVAEWRCWWKRRLVAILLTVALAFFGIVALGLVLVAPDLASRAAATFGLDSAWAALWTVLRWPVMVACLLLGLNLVYHFAPNRAARWTWLNPGAIVATGLWLLGSFGFKLYLATSGHYAATYGAIGGAIVTMLWFYVSSLAMLVGAELNAVLEKARTNRS